MLMLMRPRLISLFLLSTFSRILLFPRLRNDLMCVKTFTYDDYIFSNIFQSSCLFYHLKSNHVLCRPMFTPLILLCLAH